MSPPMVDLMLEPGVEQTFDVAIGNTGDVEPIELRLYLAPVEQARDGSYQVKEGPPASSATPSAAAWLELKQNRLTLAPAKDVSVVVKAKAPRGSIGSRVAALVFEVVPEDGANTGGETAIAGSTIFRHRVVTIVKLTVKNRANRLEAVVGSLAVAGGADPRFSSYGPSALAVLCTVTNEGNTLFNGQGQLLIRNDSGRRVRVMPLGSGRGTVLPGATVDFVSVFPEGLPPGDYTAEALIRYGGTRPLQARMPFKVVPKETAAGPAQVTSAVKLAVYPEQVNAQVPAGGFRTFPFSILNREKTPIAVRCVVEGLASSPEGELLPVAEQVSSWSAAPWLTTPSEPVVIGPGERRNLEIRVTVPKGASDGIRFAALVLEAEARGSGVGAKTVTGISTPVLISTGRNLTRQVALTDAGLAFPEPTVLAIGGKVSNTGNSQVTLSGRVILRRRGEVPKLPGGLEYIGETRWDDLVTLPLEGGAGLLLPGESRTVVALYDKVLSPGEYQAELVMGAGDAIPQRKTITFRVGPWEPAPKKLPGGK